MAKTKKVRLTKNERAIREALTSQGRPLPGTPEDKAWIRGRDYGEKRVTDHSDPASKRVEIAATAAWEITTLCDEMCEQAARLDRLKTTPQPHHSALIIKLLASRAHDLAEVAALCLTEDEANQPFADLEETVTNG